MWTGSANVYTCTNTCCVRLLSRGFHLVLLVVSPARRRNRKIGQRWNDSLQLLLRRTHTPVLPSAPNEPIWRPSLRRYPRKTRALPIRPDGNWERSIAEGVMWYRISHRTAWPQPYSANAMALDPDAQTRMEPLLSINRQRGGAQLNPPKSLFGAVGR